MTIRIQVNLLDESRSPHPTSKLLGILLPIRFTSHIQTLNFFSKKKANAEAREDPTMDKGVEVIKSKNLISKWDEKNMN